MLALATCHSAGGAALSIWYSNDGTALCSGLLDTADVAVWNAHRALLLSGPVTGVSTSAAGVVTATIAGTTYAW